MENFLLVGNGAREHAIAKAICKNRNVRLFAFISANNPGIISLVNKTGGKYKIGDIHSPKEVADFAFENKIDLAFPSPDAVLAAGVVDSLLEKKIPTAAPIKDAARLEWDKAYCRALLSEYKVDGQPKFGIFESEQEAHKFIEELGGAVAVKPAGLTGGKGVKVVGYQLKDKNEAKEYASQLLKQKLSGISSIVIEEKLEGEEFSLQAFSDGNKVFGMPMVQDHKRAYEGDLGQNTGGMGSYSTGKILPFASQSHYEQAIKIMQSSIDAFRKKTGKKFIGVLYGGFMITSDGVKLIEYNSRFGDPEAMNVLSVLESDLYEILYQLASEKLNLSLKFKELSTVCKYLVPEGYPIKSITDQPLSIDFDLIKKIGAEIFYASVYEKDNIIYTQSSRSIAIVGVSEDLYQAEQIAEKGCQAVKGRVWHRKDIGTKQLIQKRIDHIKSLGIK
jgi:phosphoribosylamine--glycine ligase